MSSAVSDTELEESSPSSRTRSVWLLQLILAASIVVTVLLVQALEPSLFGSWTFSLGVAVVIAITVVALVVPWHRVPRDVILILPFGDLVGVGLLAFGSDLRFSFFWVFPIIWIASSQRLRESPICMLEDESSK